MMLSGHFNYSYDKLAQAQKTLTPAQFQEQLTPVVAQWQQQADSLSCLYVPSQKAVSLIHNQVNLQTGYTYLEFQLARNYYAQKDTTNQVLKVQPDASYYKFLKEMPLNEQSALANANVGSFINRFEFMDPLAPAYKIQIALQSDEDFRVLSEDEKKLHLQLKMSEVKDSIVNSLCGASSSLFWQIARVRNLRYVLSEVLKRPQDVNIYRSVGKPYSNRLLVSDITYICQWWQTYILLFVIVYKARIFLIV